MIHSLHNVINIDNGSVIQRDGIGLEKIPGLIVSEPAAFNKILHNIPFYFAAFSD